MWTYRPKGKDLETAPGRKLETRVRHYNHTTVPSFSPGMELFREAFFFAPGWPGPHLPVFAKPQ
jgi:hypothetical protein